MEKEVIQKPELPEVKSKPECLKRAKELLVDPLDLLELHRDEVTELWHLLRLSPGGRAPIHVADGKSFDALLWNLETSIHPQASRDRVARRAQADKSKHIDGPAGMVARRDALAQAKTEGRGQG